MIAILLSTFNGGLYLREQLDSLFRQTYKDWVLYVRDDGSTDNTIDILNSFQKKHDNIIMLAKDTVNMGPAKSFLHLLENVEADYYMFCDQDDVWLPEKIEKTMFILKNLEIEHPGRAALVFSDLSLVDKDLRPLHPSMWEFNAYNKILEPRFLCCMNYVTGCTVAVNNLAKLSATKFKHVDLMHDALLALVVARFGVIKPIRESLILYRQHEKNAIGANRRVPLLNRLLDTQNPLFCRIADVWQTVKCNTALYLKNSQIFDFTFARFLILKLLIFAKTIGRFR